MRGATEWQQAQKTDLEISIHAPHAGCDAIARDLLAQGIDFNPRTPCGVRPNDGGGNGKAK